MASAPARDSAAAATTTAACTVTAVLTAPEAVVRGKDEDSLELGTPPDDPSDPLSSSILFVTFPDDARFDAAIGDGANPTAVRIEFWDGQIVTVTAGNQGITVTTDSNPDNVGGLGVGGALVSFAFVVFALLIVIRARAIRPRWLRLGVGWYPTVFGLSVLTVAAFVAGGCLVTQPSWVATVAEIVPPIAVALMGFPWLVFWSARRRRMRSVSMLG
jgi:hypothetical protein